MKKIKNYIDPDLAKRKITRYKYWCIKDEAGITIISSEDNPEEKGFGDHLDKIIGDNVDAEVQVKYGVNEQSSRHNAPFFIKINEEIEWVEPEEDDTVSINGVPHKVDKNGNVNINLSTPKVEPTIIENGNIDVFRQEMEMQLAGIRREHELKEEKWQVEMANRMLEQTLKFKEMMLAERETRISEREQALSQKELELSEKEQEIKEDVKGYLKQVPSALGGLVREFIKAGARAEEKPLGKAEKEPSKRKRKLVEYQVEETEEEEIDDEELEEEVEDEEEDYQEREENETENELNENSHE